LLGIAEQHGVDQAQSTPVTTVYMWSQ